MSRRTVVGLLALAASIVAVLVVVSTWGGGRAGTTSAPVLEPRQCWGTLPDDVTARCGYVSVPEDRDEPVTVGNRVRLAVVVLSRPAGEHGVPTMLLGGGPGQDVVGMFDWLFGARAALARDGLPPERYPGEHADLGQFVAVLDRLVADLDRRPLVYFDQRGTGRSEPSLACREELADCRDRLVREGVDLAAYTSAENADDVDDVRRALGHPQVDLQGGSYGSRLALEVLRRRGASVLAAVLDGVVPAQASLPRDAVRHYEEPLSALFRACAADAGCAAAYPALEAMFYRLVADLDRAPLPVGGEEPDGQLLRRTVVAALADAEKARMVPLLLHRLGADDASVWSRLREWLAEDQARVPVALGMQLSVLCAEQLPSGGRAALAAAAAGLPVSIRAGVVAGHGALLDDCDEWDVPPVDPALRAPVASDVPVLMISGALDPLSPPSYAEEARRTLTHARHVVLPALGHTDGFTSTCHATLASEFLADPSAAPATTCVAAMAGPALVLP